MTTAAESAAVPPICGSAELGLAATSSSISPECCPNTLRSIPNLPHFAATKVLPTRRRDVRYTITRIVRASLFEWNVNRGGKLKC
jgi:hypothetical protein